MITVKRFKEDVVSIKVFKKQQKIPIVTLTDGLENYRQAFDFILSKGVEFGFYEMT